jgi:hypothetical protein
MAVRSVCCEAVKGLDVALKVVCVCVLALLNLRILSPEIWLVHCQTQIATGRFEETGCLV